MTGTTSSCAERDDDVARNRLLYTCENSVMRAIMTVTGLDHTGIIAAVAKAAADNNANILNVSQTLMGDYFTMILQIDIDEDVTPLASLQAVMAEVAAEQRLDIRIQSEAIFNAMHRL